MPYDDWKLSSPPEYEADDGQRHPPRSVRERKPEMDDFDWTPAALRPPSIKQPDPTDIDF